MDEQIISAWRKKRTEEELSRIPETKKKFKTASGIEVKDVYTSLDVTPETHETLPGLYPLTRGIRASMYRNRPFTMRQVVGLGTAKHANERHRFVLSQGQTGLSNDFDLPTLTGYDSDDDKARGEVGRIGVAIDSIHDMRDLMSEIPLDSVSTSMTINHPAPVLLAMYLAVAEEQNVPWGRLNGTIQNDAFKEFFAQKTFAIGPSPSFRLACDVIEFCSHHAPKWNPISLCGYQTRDCGGTADQELGLTFAAAKAYIDETLKRGVDIDDFAPRLSFLMYVHMDVLEEVAKFRAARRMWARLLREEYGAKKEDSWRLRVHVQTGAALLTAQQPENNIARGALQCFAAALGGIQSMAISTYDEAYSIPSEKAQRLALRTQQIVALESGVTYTPDPLAGSYYVEHLTHSLAVAAWDLIQEVEELGGMTRAVEQGMPKLRIEESAARRQARVDRGEDAIVGVNKYRAKEADEVDILDIDNTRVREQQVARLERVRRERDDGACRAALQALREGAAGEANLLELSIAAVRARATVGEVSDAIEGEFGRHRAATRGVTGIYGSAFADDEGFRRTRQAIDDFAEIEGRRPRILVCKLGQDGHDRGARIIASAFADIGFDVDIGPLFQTPAEAAIEAVENDVHVVGVSTQAAGHKTLVPELVDALRDHGAGDILVVCGGVVPPKDYDFLYRAGVAGIYGPGTNVQSAAIDILRRLSGRREAAA